jgi:sugar O-acyltransferase (sialic acid O-acetyltransferase NeuD family)
MVDSFDKYNIKAQDNSIAIVGWEEGQAGRIHSWLEKSGDYHIACFVNCTDEPLNINPKNIHREASQFSYPTNNTFKNKPLINSSNWADYIKKYSLNKALITIDDPYMRNEQIQYAIENDIELINAIHPTVSVMEDAIVEKNIIIHAGALIGYRAEICSGTFISYGSIINHHCVLKDCSTIDAGVTLAGNVSVGRFATVHTGAVIINKIKIGESSVLGAGTVVIRDVPDNATVVGVPGKIIKQ